MGEWNIQDTFFSRQRLGTAGTVAKNVSKPITAKVIADGALKPGQGVILSSDVLTDGAVSATAPTTVNESLQLDAVVLLKANSLPDSAGDIIYVDGETIDVLITGFIYVKIPTSSGSAIGAYKAAVPDFTMNAEEWILYGPAGDEQRVKPIQFIHSTDLDNATLSDIENETQLIYVPDRALDRAVDSFGTPI